MKRRDLLLASLSAMVARPVRAAATPLVFTAIPDQDETRLVERFGKVARYLEDRIGHPVRYVPVKSYPAAVTAFINDQVQLAWFGGFTGVQARARLAGSHAIAQGAEDAAFHFLLLAGTGTGLAPADAFPKAIAGRSLSFGARTSTSGRLMPEYAMRKAFGRPPEAVFSRVGFSGDHSRTIQLVQSGAYDVGPVDASVWQLDDAAGKVDPARVAAICRSPPFPDYQWTIRADLDARCGDGTAERVRAALLALDDPAILREFGRSRFIPADDAEYAPLVDVGHAIGLLS